MKIIKIPDEENYYLQVEVADGDGSKLKTIDLNTTDYKTAQEIVRLSKVLDMDKVSKVTRLTSEVIQSIIGDKPVLVKDAIEAWVSWMGDAGRSERTIGNNKQTILKWAKEMLLLEENIGAITPKNISGWVNDRKSESKRGTRMMKLSCIRGFMEFASIKRWTVSDPSALIKVDHKVMTHEQKETKRKTVFTTDEIDFLLAKCAGAEPPSITPGFLRVAIVLGRDLALRLGDICCLEWGCFDFEANTVIVWTDKTNARVKVPMTKRVINAVMNINNPGDRYLFPAEKAIYEGKNRAMLSVVFGRFFSRNGFEGHSFHDLRATYATTMANQGATVQEIATQLGHSRTSTTQASYIRKEGAAKLG